MSNLLIEQPLPRQLVGRSTGTWTRTGAAAGLLSIIVTTALTTDYS